MIILIIFNNVLIMKIIDFVENCRNNNENILIVKYFEFVMNIESRKNVY